MRCFFFLNLAFLIVPALFHMAAGAKAEFNFNKLSAGDKIQVPTNYNNHTLLKARSAFLNPNHSATRFLPRPKFLGRTRKVGPFSSQLRLVFHSSFQQKKSPSVQNIHIWLNFNFFLTKLFLIGPLIHAIFYIFFNKFHDPLKTFHDPLKIFHDPSVENH